MRSYCALKTYRSILLAGLWCLITLFPLVLPALSAADSQTQPLCNRCHRKQAEGTNVHPIMKTGGCVSCHTNPHSAKHKALKFLPAKGTDLCFICHPRDKFTKKIQHPPVAAGDCTACHEIHVSENRKLLTTKMPDLCFTCHDKAKFENKALHPPVAAGECTGCHDPHSSDVPKLLIADTPALCFTCHDENQFIGKKRGHMPARYGYCDSCHDPHASAHGKLLKAEPPTLCFNCHDEDLFGKHKVVHAPVAGGLCTSCHAAHQSEARKLLQTKTPELCFNCHDHKKFTLRNIHPPVENGRCNACHRPHVSNMKSLLPRAINALCAKCHKKIGPRHVVSSTSSKGHPVKTDREKLVDGKKIRLSCISCHDPHSTNTIKLFKFPAKSPLDLCSHCHPK